ncbi:MAG TPA: hypothetical protein VMF67_12020 [Rhizomicrobium sp.]|nr:hypothetical protein [Rhizomicrobium sp.]
MCSAVAHEEGYFHLGPNGWSREDRKPFPTDRLETWRYEMDQPSPAAKQQIHLTRVWIQRNAPESQRRTLHARFGEAVAPEMDKSILVQCRI